MQDQGVRQHHESLKEQESTDGANAQTRVRRSVCARLLAEFLQPNWSPKSMCGCHLARQVEHEAENTPH
jgi:hypothetical protein